MAGLEGRLPAVERAADVAVDAVDVALRQQLALGMAFRPAQARIVGKQLAQPRIVQAGDQNAVAAELLRAALRVLLDLALAGGGMEDVDHGVLLQPGSWNSIVPACFGYFFLMTIRSSWAMQRSAGDCAT